jgi:VanZ family protein
MEDKINIRTAVVFWLAAVGYMCLIFYVSSLSRIPDLPGNSDKLVHMAAYVPLGFLLYLSLKRSGVNRYVLIIALLIAGIYGITDELHQSFVPGRDASMGDAAADFAGAFLGSYGARYFRGRG